MAILTIDAYDLGEEFLHEIKTRFSVDLKDGTNAPWSVVFEGEQHQLQAMQEAYWPGGASADYVDLNDQLPLEKP